jgi:hypothetical protein
MGRALPGPSAKESYFIGSAIFTDGIYPIILLKGGASPRLSIKTNFFS